MESLTRYIWPEGKKAALLVSLDLDGETPYLWRTRKIKSNVISELELRRFEARVGFWRLLEILKETEISASFFVPGFMAEKYPKILPTLVASGHEIGLHGYLHESVDELTVFDNKEILKRSIQIFKTQVGFAPKGYRSPCWEMTREFPALLETNGIEYDSSLMGFDHPYEFSGLTEIPVHWSTDDAIFFLYAGNGLDQAPPACTHMMLQEWKAELVATIKHGGLFTLTLHPWVMGRAVRAELVREFLNFAKGQEGLWIATAEGLVNYHKSSPNRSLFCVD